MQFHRCPRRRFHRPFCPHQISQGRAAMDLEHAAGLVQANLASGAIKKLGPQNLLKFPNGFRDGGLCDQQCLRRLRQTARPRRFQKAADMAETEAGIRFHNSEVICISEFFNLLLNSLC